MKVNLQCFSGLSTFSKSFSAFSQRHGDLSSTLLADQQASQLPYNAFFDVDLQRPQKEQSRAQKR